MGADEAIQTRLLTKEEFAATFSERMEDITGREDSVSPTGVLDIQPYLAAIPSADLRGHAAESWAERVYRSEDGRYDHVLFQTETKNVFLAVVVNLVSDNVLGHYLLDLNAEYGLV
jgi:hypothetical protein